MHEACSFILIECVSTRNDWKLGTLYCLIDGCSASFAKKNHDVSSHMHVHNLNADVHDQILASKSGTLMAFMKPNLKAALGSCSHPCAKALTKMIADCNLPPSLLDRQSFKDFFDVSRSHKDWKLPSRRQFLRPSTGHLSSYSRDLETESIATLANAMTFANIRAISLTFDIWTKHGRSFLGVTAYSISKAFKWNYTSLGLVDFDESHTAAAVAAKLKSVSEGFIGDFSSVFAATHDAASNNTGAKFVEATPGLIRLTCIAHRASNASKLFFKSSKSARHVLTVARTVTKILSKSSSARLLLHKYQRLANEDEVSIKMTPNTRFNCGFLSIDSLLSQRRHVTKAIVDLVHGQKKAGSKAAKYLTDLLMESFWDTMQQIRDALKPLYDFICQCSARDAHLSDVLILLRATNAELTSLASNKYSANVLHAMNRYFSPITEGRSIFVICASLDPRFKRDFLPTHAERLITWQFILADMKRRLQSVSTTVPVESLPADEATETAWLLDGSHLIDVEARLKQNLKIFLEAKGLQSTATPSEARDWWATTNDCMELKQYASLYFSVQSTEIENEREFSSAGLCSLT
jgi:hypothetical protein